MSSLVKCGRVLLQYGSNGSTSSKQQYQQEYSNEDAVHNLLHMLALWLKIQEGSIEHRRLD